MTQIGQTTFQSFGSARSLLKIRGDREWKAVMKGEMPTPKLHLALTGNTKELVAQYLAKRSYKDRDVANAPGFQSVVTLISELKAEYKRREAEQVVAHLANAGRNAEILISYAPPIFDDSAAGRAMHAAIQAAKSVGDPDGVRRTKSELERANFPRSAIPDEATVQKLILPIRRRIDTFRVAGDFGAQIVAQGDIAAELERTGAWANAVPELQKLIELQSKIPDRVYSFQSHSRLAKALSCSNRGDEALELLGRLHRGKKWKVSRDLDTKTSARVAEHLAAVQIENGYYADAATTLKQALQIRKRLGNPVGVGSVWYYRARLALRQNNWRQVNQYLSKARHQWRPLGVRELIGRLFVSEARVVVDEFAARHRDLSHPKRRDAARLRSALVAVESGLKCLDGHLLSGDVPAERANALQTRGSIRVLLDPKSPKARSAAIKDYELSLSSCFDIAGIAMAHRALADLNALNGDPAAARRHAVLALEYLKHSRKLCSEDADHLGRFVTA